MKKMGLLIVLFIIALPSFAQDIITKRDGSDIQAKVLEVSKSEVKYKAWDNLEGPTFILTASDVLIIRFENGTNHVMESVPQNRAYQGGYYTSDVAILEKVDARYKALKSYYNKEEYKSIPNPKYGLGLPWLNLLIPGLAQYIMNEPGLGTKYLLLNVGCNVLISVGFNASSDYSASRILTSIGAMGSIVIGVASIVNAYDVAKVKSLFSEDINNYRRGYSFSLQPAVNFSVTPDGCMPAPGLSLCMTF